MKPTEKKLTLYALLALILLPYSVMALFSYFDLSLLGRVIAIFLFYTATPILVIWYVLNSKTALIHKGSILDKKFNQKKKLYFKKITQGVFMLLILCLGIFKILPFYKDCYLLATDYEPEIISALVTDVNTSPFTLPIKRQTISVEGDVEKYFSLYGQFVQTESEYMFTVLPNSNQIVDVTPL